jgi:hypothetical protein
VAPSPPLIPRRVSKSYENIKLKGQESVDLPATATAMTTSVVSHPRPPIPPRKGYENVELKEPKKKMEEEKERGRGTENLATKASSPGVRPPIPLKRARSPQPPKEYCPVTPPVPARRSTKEKAAAGVAENSKKTKLFKVTSMPYCPVSPDDSSPPQFPARGKNRSVSNPFLPLEIENDDSANCDTPSPYYSLPPDSLSPMAEIDTRFHIDDSDEGEEELSKDGEEGGGLEMYLTLDEEILSKARIGSGGGMEKKSIKSPVQHCPPLPPKVRVRASSLAYPNFTVYYQSACDTLCCLSVNFSTLACQNLRVCD